MTCLFQMNMTPLILAASGGREKVVRLLISRGAQVNAKNEGGHSALQYAASKGWLEVIWKTTNWTNLYIMTKNIKKKGRERHLPDSRV